LLFSLFSFLFFTRDHETIIHAAANPDSAVPDAFLARHAPLSAAKFLLSCFFLSFLFFSFLLLHLMGHGEPKRHPVQRNLVSNLFLSVRIKEDLDDTRDHETIIHAAANPDSAVPESGLAAAWIIVS
jgi:hypothetical protein